MLGAYSNMPRKMNYYRCGSCSFNLYPLDECRRCPKCKTPTAEMQANESEIMTEVETRALLSAWRFKHYIDDETEGARTTRRDAALRAEKERKDRLGRFDEVIEGAGFLDWEMERLKALHDQLGGSHLDV